MQYDKLIENCESALRSGQGRLAAELLSHLRINEIPRSYRLSLANLCRRAGLLNQGLRILTPILYPELKGIQAPASDMEKAEYAVLLERSGAVREALGFLKDLDSTKAPEILLYRAFCHFKSWNYGSSIPDLQKFIQLIEDPYQRLVGQVNLAAAFVAESRAQESRELLAEIKRTGKAQGYMRLVANSLELLAQLQISLRKLDQAKAALNEAAEIFANDQTTDRFFVRKWQLVVEALETHQIEPLNRLRQKARDMREWETLREADLVELKIQTSEELLAKLYFGTPFADYKARIERSIGRRPLADEYLFGDPRGPVFDTETGTFSGNSFSKPGHLVHKVLSALTRDLYRPLRIGGLFAELFPDEHFNVFSSPNRVHQLLHRTRDWLAQNEIPARIQAQEGQYALAVEGPVAFKISNSTAVDRWSPLIARLKSELRGASEFTSQDLRKHLGLSRSSATRFLRWAIESGHATRYGQNNFTSYRFS